MNFQGKGRPMTDDGVDRICELLSVTEPEIWAVLTVETRGFGYLNDRRPQILFERHVFHRETDGRHDEGHEGVSNSRPGGYLGGAAEYDRLEEAMALDQEAALKSASWGISQVMGFNHEPAGFSTVEAMVEAMVKDEDEQLLAMGSFIEATNLTGALRRKNWVSFARGYNGPSFKKNEYDTRLAAAHSKYLVLLPDLALRTAQAALGYLGFQPGPVDGIRGRRTRSALMAFQEKEGLAETGEVDLETEARLMAQAFPG